MLVGRGDGRAPPTTSTMCYQMHIFVYNFGDFSTLLPGTWVSGFYIIEVAIVTPIEVSSALAPLLTCT